MRSSAGLYGVTAVTLSAVFLNSCTQQAPVTPVTYTVQVGGEAGTDSLSGAARPRWAVMRFYPSAINVNEGDTVVWAQSSEELHTVTFLEPGTQAESFVIPEGGTSTRFIFNPKIAFKSGTDTYSGAGFHNSGIMDLGPVNAHEYKLTFTKAGTYNYLCSVHGGTAPDGTLVGMSGSVVVHPRGTARQKTPAQVSTAAAASVQADHTAALALETAAAQVASPTVVGTVTTYNVNVGYDGGLFDLMRYLPGNVTVHVGDRVTFTNPTMHTPHTVTFTSGGAEPALVMPEPQVSGPPVLVLNPVAVFPSGGTTYNGSGYVNSGVLAGQMDQGPHSVTFTFTAAGTFRYVCLFHSDLGMSAQVTVMP